MRPRSIILLVLALGCGLVASIGISQVLQRPDQGPAGETAPVWVATADIKRDDPLNMQNLKLEQWPKDKIPPGALSKLEDVDGKRAKVGIFQGEPVIGKKLLGKDEQSVSNTLPKGFRAFTVQGDAVNSHGGLLHPGDRVDVLVFVNKSTGQYETGTKTIMQDIEVFAINDQVRSMDDKGADSIAAKTVTLLVTPNQAQKLALAAEIGKIRLDMRGPDDDARADSKPTTVEAMFGTSEKTDRAKEIIEPAFDPKASGLGALLNQQKPQPAPQPEPIPPQDETFIMQIIRGTEISQAEFSHKLADPDHWDANGITPCRAVAGRFGGQL